VYAQISEDAGEESAGATDGDEQTKNQSILQMKLRKVVMLIGKAGYIH